MINKTAHRAKPLALVVDDDLSLRLSMCAALTKAGFTTIEAENGRQAIDSFQSNRPDLILLDVIMPDMDGFETCKAIRKLHEGRYSQILMVTGLDDTESIERAFEAGANDFVSKPLNWTMLGHRGKYMLRAGRAFQELNRNKHRLSRTQELAKLGNWDLDLINNTFHCSAQALRLLGAKESEGEVTYKNFFKPVVVQERDKVIEHIESAIRANRPFSINYRIILPDGTQRFILNSGEIFYNENGVAEEVSGAVQDVTQLKNAEEEIRLLAFYDGLTGLANRILFMDRLDREIAASKRHERIFALLFLDLDQFKRINDTFGHHVGDLLLKSVSETLQKCIRNTDTAARVVNTDSEAFIARLGGDEFILLLSDINAPENASVVARRILQEMPKTHELEGHSVSVTTSIGISTFPTDGENSELLLKHADSAMYHAKETGRNNYQFYKESLNAAVLERFSIEQDLKHAMEREEFVLHYQPLIELSTRKIIGAEALIRWMHPQKGMIPPDKFIPLAEESGLIVEINKWVIQTACKQNKHWRESGFTPIRIAVNLSGYQFTSQNIVQIIRDALEEASLDAKNLEVEITENTLMQNTEDTVRVLEQMRDLKLRIALDDFGTGYSSLSYLTSFPVDTIKIDRSFVMGCGMANNTRIIIKAIVAMGHSLGMKVVAEGIESEDQFELLKEYGANEGQGFHFSPAVSQGQFTKFLEKEVL
jgi:diguanylate cyclase (GGDEF)-like protein/PAS domain S-box-containing protein